MFVYYDYDLSGWLFIGDPEPVSTTEPEETPAAQADSDASEADSAVEATSEASSEGSETLLAIQESVSLIEARSERMQEGLYGCLLLLAATVLLSIFSRLWGSV